MIFSGIATPAVEVTRQRISEEATNNCFLCRRWLIPWGPKSQSKNMVFTCQKNVSKRKGTPFWQYIFLSIKIRILYFLHPIVLKV
jgi:hypothetical protein